MLKKYLQTQQDNFDIMRSRHGQLQQKADFEQQRAQLLAQHIDAMESNQQMRCSLSLQNLSGLKHILQDMAQRLVDAIMMRRRFPTASCGTSTCRHSRQRLMQAQVISCAPT